MTAGERTGSVVVFTTCGLALALVLTARFLGPSTFYVTEREWQTAITSWWILQSGGNLFAAITPIMGPPWQLPMEAPLFQWVAAGLATDSIGLEDTGRILSLLFFALNVLVVHRLALALDLSRRTADTAAVLMISSPLFLAYSYSFTIESTANLAASLWLWFFIRWLRRPTAGVFAAVLFLGVFASLAKPTTWAVYAAVATTLSFWAVLNARQINRSAGAVGIGTMLLIAAPLAVGLVWTSFSDSVKMLNPLTAELTSKAITAWTFGPLTQRLSPATWVDILSTVILLVLGPLTFLGCAWCLFRRLKDRATLPPHGLLLAFAAGAIAGPVVFTNLYAQHDYYAMAGGIFVILLAAALLGDRLHPMLLILLAVSNLATGAGFLLVKQANYEDPLSDGLAHAVQNLPSNQHLVVYGSYMDSRVPYLAGQKALQTRETDPDHEAVNQVLDQVPVSEIGAVLTRAEAYTKAARHTAQRFSLNQTAELARGVRIFYASKNARFLDLSPIDLEGEYQKRVRGFDPDAPGPWGLLQPTGPEAAPGFGLARRGNLYLFDIERGLRVVHRRWAPDHR